MRRRSKTPTRPFNAYKCHICHWFHIGTVVKPVAKTPKSRHQGPQHEHAD